MQDILQATVTVRPIQRIRLAIIQPAIIHLLVTTRLAMHLRQRAVPQVAAIPAAARPAGPAHALRQLHRER